MTSDPNGLYCCRRERSDNSRNPELPKRFQAELEFVQSLASPQYINWLAQNRYFDDVKFINYLHYLRYWKQPAYASFITYPHCLYFLELLLDKDFRTNMASNASKELLHSQQLYFYQNYRRNRLKPT